MGFGIACIQQIIKIEEVRGDAALDKWRNVEKETRAGRAGSEEGRLVC